MVPHAVVLWDCLLYFVLFISFTLVCRLLMWCEMKFCLPPTCISAADTHTGPSGETWHSILHYEVTIVREDYNNFLLSLKGVSNYPEGKVHLKYTTLYRNKSEAYKRSCWKYRTRRRREQTDRNPEPDLGSARSDYSISPARTRMKTFVKSSFVLWH